MGPRLAGSCKRTARATSLRCMRPMLATVSPFWIFWMESRVL
jgi:hypothetical protein